MPTPSAASGAHPPRSGGVISAGSVPDLVQRFNLYLYATVTAYFRTEFFDPDSPDPDRREVVSCARPTSGHGVSHRPRLMGKKS